MFDDHQLIQQGWQCPVCKRVYSPSTYVCWYCGRSGCTATTKTVTNDPEQLVKDYKRILDEILKNENGDHYDLYLMNPNYVRDLMGREAYGHAEGDAGGGDAPGGTGQES